MHDAASLPAYVAELDGRPVGLVTYAPSGDELEVVTLDALVGSVGVGTALLETLLEQAEAHGCRRVWLITGNDNLGALGFYQRRGFRMVAVHSGAIDRARWFKPGIPGLGAGGIGIHDEVELAYVLPRGHDDPEKVALEPVREEEKSVLANLLQLYRHDFSLIRAFELTEHGTFVYRYLDTLFLESSRQAWLIRHRGHLAGFAMVRALPEGRSELSEFFVVRGHRRRGVGRRAAALVFSARPGDWELAYDLANEEAAGFWPLAVAAVSGHAEHLVVGPPERPTEQMVLRFSVPGAADR